MTNRVVGIIGSAICGVSVLCFAVSMIVGIFVNTLFLSCFASMFIALGFMLFMCAVSGSNKDNEKRACGNVSLVCAAILCYADIFGLLCRVHNCKSFAPA